MDDTSYYFMWAKRNCPYCQKAQQLLFEGQKLHMAYMMDDQFETLEKVKKHFEWKTVPIIIKQSVEGPTELIGGHAELLTHLSANDL
jgi:glutaredoxin